jgi:hypothetical protein
MRSRLAALTPQPNKVHSELKNPESTTKKSCSKSQQDGTPKKKPTKPMTEKKEKNNLKEKLKEKEKNWKRGGLGPLPPPKKIAIGGTSDVYNNPQANLARKKEIRLDVLCDLDEHS